jgi:inhibitor of cysteine peptidase
MRQQMRLMGRLLVIGLLGLLLAACGDSGSGSVPQTISLTLADSGKSVTVRQNDQITVTLDGNPSTGYGWTVAAGTGTILTQVGEATYTPKTTDALTTGAGGSYLFTFKAAQQGSATLKLVYAQPWNNNLPAQTFEVTVVVG